MIFCRGTLEGVGIKDKPFWTGLVSPSVSIVVPKLTMLLIGLYCKIALRNFFLDAFLPIVPCSFF